MLNKWKKIIDHALWKYLNDGRIETPPQLQKAMLYAVFPGGKRIRPILTIASAGMCGASTRKALPVACAVELIHSYSLVHDDLPSMDNDDTRRGKPTLHKKFSEGIAILVGDALLTKAFEIITKYTKIKSDKLLNAIKVLSKASGACGMVGGQVADTFTDFKKLNRTQKIRTLNYIHSHKTGSLIQASVVMGGIIAGASKKQLTALKNFGKKIGLAFQIIDDLFDKDKNKLTYPAIYTEESAKELAIKLITSAKKDLIIFGKKNRVLSELADCVVKRKN